MTSSESTLLVSLIFTVRRRCCGHFLYLLYVSLRLFLLPLASYRAEYIPSRQDNLCNIIIDSVPVNIACLSSSYLLHIYIVWLHL